MVDVLFLAAFALDLRETNYIFAQKEKDLVENWLI